MSNQPQTTVTFALSAPRGLPRPFSAGYTYNQGEIPKITFRRTRSQKIVKHPAA